MALAPCPSCSRHVRHTEPRCPFCERALSLALPVRRSPAQRLGRAAMAAFGAAAVSTSIGACGARGGLEIPGPAPARVDAAALGDAGSFVGAYGAPPPADAALVPDAGLDEDVGASHAEYGGPPEDAGLDAGELTLPAYGGPWFAEDAGQDAGDDAGCEDPGCFSSDYGAPPAPQRASPSPKPFEHAVVDARMADVGGHHTLVGESDVWQRQTMFSSDACEVDFDRHGRLRQARYADYR